MTMLHWAAVFLGMLVSAQAQAEAAPPSTVSDYRVEWPRDRQHLLVGDYAGTLRDGWRRDMACEFLDARLTVNVDGRYALHGRCTDGSGDRAILRGSWWVDEIAGSCLILMQEPPIPGQDDRLFGFRIVGAAVALVQDGGNCQAADERDRGMILERIPTGEHP